MKSETMRTIGLIGGMSWESTAVYYQRINQAMARRRGGLHSAPLLLHSCDFAEIAALQRQDRWDTLADLLAGAGRALQVAGADCLAICTNTMHRVAARVQAEVTIPLLDIRDVTGAAIRAQGGGRIGLLGTRYTMEQAFFRDHLHEWGVETIIPDMPGRDDVHAIIFEELCRGIQRAESRTRLTEIITHLAEQGAQGVILGCTELMLLLGPDDSPLPLFDTTALHCDALVGFAAGQGVNASGLARPLPAAESVLSTR